jgi:hypothetical protein
MRTLYTQPWPSGLQVAQLGREARLASMVGHRIR